MTMKRDFSKRQQSRNTTGQSGDAVKRRFSRRTVMLALGGVAATAAGAMAFSGIFGFGRAAAKEVLVYKSPSCECCGNWAMHLRQSGFDVLVKNIDDISPVKQKAGIPYELESCHTALVGGYAVEGHVPAENIHKMLADRPDIKGLAVPGMPASAPGMDGPDPEPYTVFSFDADGKTKAYASY
ncbi:MAG: DUF411 domain-containing protein [Hyphomicrobiales bacterium]|nr:DUF411 domain-containing protein [Hyphomicrobiales bacterium]